jgi:hypothetical protein
MPVLVHFWLLFAAFGRTDGKIAVTTFGRCSCNGRSYKQLGTSWTLYYHPRKKIVSESEVSITN